MLRRSLRTIVLIFLAFFLGTCKPDTGQIKPHAPVAGLYQEPVSTDAEQILFGDLHVHTTLSVDALAWNLPANKKGKGLRPLSEACDFARFCSGIDFFSSNDHAESLTPPNWQSVKEDIRECNQMAGDPENPQLVAFTGFEWTQLADSYKDYYGHKNVIFKETSEDQLPVRPIASRPFPLPPKSTRALARLLTPLVDPLHAEDYIRLSNLLSAVAKMSHCPEGVPVRELPPDCLDLAPTAAQLFSKLDEWGFDSLVIPHGTTWGLHVPYLVDWSTQIDENDPHYQRLIEVYSGHGNLEEYREWRSAALDENGNFVCPEPTSDYLPCCWQAGEIARKRCSGTPEKCEKVAAEARKKYVESDFLGHRTLKAKPDEWLDCGQCRDCFKPAFSHRPGASAQRALTATGKDGQQFKFGFIASSDTHKAKAGSGYAPLLDQTDFTAGRNWWYVKMQAMATKTIPWEFERQQSFWYTGGLVAAHANGRDRDSIWQALLDKHTYGTSGVRILLWFDLVNPMVGENAPMGSDLIQDAPPRFRVKAVGSPILNPGCPQVLVEAMGKEFIDDVCDGQCYNPSNRRHPIVRIEVVKVRQQLEPEEPIGPLVQDPFVVFDCDPEKSVCEAEFEDPDYAGEDRTVAYYVRAIQEEAPSVNAQNFKCRYEDDTCVEMDPCRSTPDPDNTCMGVAEERAWSSPIYLTPSAS